MVSSARALAIMLTIVMVASVIPVGFCYGEDSVEGTTDLTVSPSDLVLVKDGMTVTMHRMTVDDVDDMRSLMGVKDTSRNYNVLVDGMGTGLAPPSDEEYDLMEGQYSVVDVQYNDLGDGLPIAYDLSALNTFPKVGNQGSQGSCAAWAMTYYCYGAIEAADNGWTSAKSGASSQLISPAWTYNRVNDYDQGSSMTTNGWVIRDWGVPTLATMPYVASDCISWGNEAAMREAPLHRGSSVISASDLSTDAIKTIVQSGKPVTFALDANQYSACFSDNGASKIISAAEYTPNTPNHAQTIVGWNDTITDDETGAFRVVNSWGTSWGESGYYWITYSAFAEAVTKWTPNYMDDLVDYTPSMIATWHYDSAPGRDTSFTLKLQNNNTGATVDSMTYYYRSSFSNGAMLKHANYMAVDISDFASSYSATNSKFVIEFSGGASQGTISSFRVERYDGGYSSGQATHISRQSSGLPKTTSGVVTTFMSPYSKMSYAEAMDSSGLTYTSTGSARWVPEVQQSMNGGDALQSGDIPDGQSSRLTTTVMGPCNIEFDWKVSSESGDNYVCSLDGSVQSTISGTTNWAHLQIAVGSGSHTMEWAFSKNSANSRNDDCAYLDKVFLSTGGGGDVTPPLTSMTLDGTMGNNGWYRSSVTVSLSASDASGITATYYRLNGGSWQTYGTPFSVSADGSTQVEYYSVDTESNTEIAQSSTVKVDRTAPNTSSSLSSYTVTLTSSDATSGVHRTFYRVDGGSWSLYSAAFSAGASGQHTVEFNSTDNAGNVEGTKQISVGTADITPPTTTASLAGTSGQNAWYVSSVTVTLTASDPSGITSRNYRIDGGSWTAYSSPFAVSTDGTHTIEYYSVDSLGNTEGVKSVNLKIDTIKPSSSSSVSSYTVTLSASDASSGVYRTFYRIDSGAWTLYGAAFSAGSTGQHIVQFNSTDNAGNVEVTKQVTVGSSDSTPPTTTASLTGTSGQNGWYTSSVTVTLTATDSGGVASRHYRIDSGSWTTYSVPFTLSTEGSHTVEFYSIDNAGNTEGVKSVNLKIDTIKPSSSSSVSSYTVTLSASDASSGVDDTYYRVGPSGTYSLYTVPFSAGSAGQVYTVYYYSIDNAGNTETVRTVQVGTADTTPPSTSVTLTGTLGGSGWYTSSVTISLTSSDNVAVQRTYYRWQGATSWSTFSSTFSTSTEGDRVLEYYSVDTTGNSETAKSVHVKIDRTAPTSSSSVSGGSVTLTATDSRSGVSFIEYRIDFGSWVTYAGTFTVSPLWEAHIVEFRAKDLAGNQEAVRSRTVGTDDVTPPVTSVSVTGPAGGSEWYLGSVSATITASDPSSGPNQTWYSLDGAAWTRYNGPVTISGQGTHQLHYYSIDLAGNVETQRSLSVGIDSVAPSTVPFVDNGMVSLSGTDSTSGMAAIHYRFDSGMDDIYEGLVTIPDPYQDHTLRYHGVDMAGNIEGEHTLLIPASNGTELLPPGPPTGLQAILTDGTVQLSWQAPEDDGGSAILGYGLYRATSSGEETYMASTSSLQYTDASVAVGHTYYYFVKANNSVGDSIASQEAYAQVVSLPSAPRDLALEAIPDQVQVSWSAPLSDGGLPLSGYLLMRGTTSGGTDTVFSLPSNTLSYLDEDVEEGVTYYYRVSAVNALGEGQESAEHSALVPYQVGPPLSLSVQLKGETVTVSWLLPIGPSPSGYRVFRSNDAESPTGLVDITGLQYDDRDLVPGQTYYYSVAALYGDMVGPRSGELSVTIPEAGPEPPSTAEGLGAMVSPGGINLDWAYAHTDREQLIGFEVFRSTSADMSYAALLTTVNTTNYLDGSALPGVTYYYQVKALNQAGEGPASLVASASRPADAGSLPGSPEGLEVVVNGAQMTISWSMPTEMGSAGLLGYRLYRSADDGSPRLLATLDELSHLDAATLPDHPYQYWVSAYNAIGESGMAGPVTISRARLVMDDPMMPQGLTVSMVLGQVELSWEVPADIPLQYYVYRGSSAEDMVLIATLDGDMHSFEDQDGWEGAFYSVGAVFEDGVGPGTPATMAEGASYESDLPETGGSMLSSPWFWIALVGLFAIAFVVVRMATRRGK